MGATPDWLSALVSPRNDSEGTRGTHGLRLEEGRGPETF